MWETEWAGPPAGEAALAAGVSWLEPSSVELELARCRVEQPTSSGRRSAAAN